MSFPPLPIQCYYWIGLLIPFFLAHGHQGGFLHGVSFPPQKISGFCEDMIQGSQVALLIQNIPGFSTKASVLGKPT